jgi:hypothetical protein
LSACTTSEGESEGERERDAERGAGVSGRAGFERGRRGGGSSEGTWGRTYSRIGGQPRYARPWFLGSLSKGNAAMMLSLLGLRHLAWGGLVAACAASMACSSSNNPPADAFMSAEVGGGMNCEFAAPVTGWLPVGTPTGERPTTVQDQGSTGTGTASITCAVQQVGSGFDISLQVSVEGTQGGNIEITSPSGAGAVTTSGAKGITASFYNSTDQGPYTDTNCTLTYTYMGQNVPISPPVAPGRIWGHLNCLNAVENGGEVKAGMKVSCAASADFLFEQCSQ